MRSFPALGCLALLVALAGCDQLGIESASAVAARRDADGKAVGAACRHAGRALEDCYSLNRRADRAAVFAGWREMNDYMRENNIEAVAPLLQPGPAPSASRSEPDDEPEAEPADAAQDGAKGGAKKHARAKAG